MADETSDHLRDLLRRRVASAAEEALRSDGRGPAEEADSITRLARLVELYDGAKPPTPRRRWPLFVVLGATFVIVSALIALRIPETEIELDLSLSELGFGLPMGQKLTETIALSGLGVSGLRVVDVPKSREREPRTVRFGDAESWGMRMSTAADGDRRGSIDLEPLLLPASTHVWMRRMVPRGQYRLSMTGPAVELRASANGPIQITLAGPGNERVDFATPKVFAMRGGDGQLDIDVTFPESAAQAVAPQLVVDHLSFLRIDQAKDGDRTLVHRVSTILSGTLYFESLNSKEHKLRANEVLEFESVKGEIRALHLEPDHIDLRFHGRVRGMSIGSGEGQRSLMPTWLEWLKERHGLSLFWGSALYLFGMVAGAFRWLGRPL